MTESLEKEAKKTVIQDQKYNSHGLPLCRLCGQAHEDIKEHIILHDITIEEYSLKFPDFPLSPKEGTFKKGSLSYGEREKKDFSVYETFGFYWVPSLKKDKMVEGYATPGPLTPEIDENYVFNPEYTSIALLGLFLKDKVLTYGPTGSGKTTLWEQIAARLNANFVRVNFDAGITRSDLVGQWVVKGKEMVFQYGILSVGLILPGTIMCLDEWDSIGEDCSFVLQRPLEQNSQLLIMEKGDEVLTLHPDNIIVATANTSGQGDDTGLYSAGTRIQNYAQINRFSLTIIVDYLSKEEEKQILRNKYSEDKLEPIDVEIIVEAVHALRQAYMNGVISAPLSTRDLLNWAEKYVYLSDIKNAAKYCFINRYPMEDRETIKGVIDHCVD